MFYKLLEGNCVYIFMEGNLFLDKSYVLYMISCNVYTASIMRQKYYITKSYITPREDAGGLSREYVLRIPSVS